MPLRVRLSDGLGRTRFRMRCTTKAQMLLVEDECTTRRLDECPDVVFEVHHVLIEMPCAVYRGLQIWHSEEIEFVKVGDILVSVCTEFKSVEFKLSGIHVNAVVQALQEGMAVSN